MKNFSCKILFLDRSDINTDEIIPAKYLTELTKEALKPYCLEDLSLARFDPKKDIEGKAVIITRANFGCGSSREHAPWVLGCNNINLVIAENFARIFRQNMFNCGMMAISLTAEQIADIFDTFAGSEATCETELENLRARVMGAPAPAENMTWKKAVNSLGFAEAKKQYPGLYEEAKRTR